MSQNYIDEGLVLNTGDNLDRSTAMNANLDIDTEDALESLDPRDLHYRFSQKRRVGQCLRWYAVDVRMRVAGNLLGQRTDALIHHV